MKKILIRLLILFLGTSLFSQETGNDSYTIQRLLIFNQKGEVLLEKNDFGWLAPALRHNSKTTIKKGLKNLASEFGLEISSPEIGAIFMFISDYRSKSNFRQYYKTTVVNGQIKIPKSKKNAQWFTVKQAIKMMSLPETKAPFVIRDMSRQVLKYPNRIWGGTFELSKVNEKISYKTIESFYPLK